jgi:hypothetical protein
MYTLLIVLGAILTVWFLYSWLSVRTIEGPKYDVTTTAQGYEIRTYDAYIIAETTISDAADYNEATQKGFPIVAGYIFGDNTAQDTIAMTTPVQTQADNSKTIAMTVPVNTQREAVADTYNISFVMPSAYTLETLPKPNDKRVVIKAVPSRKVAVKRFTWSAKNSVVQKQEKALLSALARDGIKTIGTTRIARYNPPWTLPFMLRIEVQIDVI